MVYNTDYAVMQFCDGTNWVSMASQGTVTESDPEVSTLTANNFCFANSGATAIQCTAAALVYATSGSLLTVSAQAATDKPLIVKGFASQSANLTEWQNSSGTALASVDATGTITGAAFSGVGTALTALNAANISTGTVATARLGTGTASSNTYLRGDGAWTTAVGTVAADSLDFDEMADAMTIDAATTVAWAGTTTTGLTLNANSLTSGGALAIAQSGAANLFTGDLLSVTSAASNGAFTGTGLRVGLTGASSQGTAVNITNAGTSGSTTLRVNDDGTYTDTTPFIIDATGQVGIGTAAPGAQLHVSASTAATKGEIIRAAASQTANLTEWQNSSGTALSYVDAAGVINGVGSGLTTLNASNLASGTVPVGRLASSGTASTSTFLRGDNTWATPTATAAAAGSTGYVQFNASGAAAADAALFWDNTNKRLGIGTSSPGAALNVGGSIQISGTGSYPSTGTGISMLWDGTQSVMQSSDRAGAISMKDLFIQAKSQQFWTGTGNAPTVRMTIDSSGNIGIGTSAPTRKLDIDAGSSGDPVATFLATGVADGTGVSLFVGKNAAAVGGNGIFKVFGNVGTPASSRMTLGMFGDNLDGGVGLTVLKGGNVGIGTTAPAAKLDVVTGGGGRLYFSDYGCGTFGGIGGSATLTGCANYALLTSGTDTYINRPSGSTIRFREANGEQMIIASGGNVGIGTTTPVAKLHSFASAVSPGNGIDTFAMVTSGNGYGGGIGLQDGTGNFGVWTDGNGTNARFGFGSNLGALSTALSLTSTGNLGVGAATSPATTLDVGTSGNMRGAILYLEDHDGTLGKKARLFNYAEEFGISREAAGFGYEASVFSLNLNTGNAYFPSGTLGVGMTSSYKLAVAGDIYSSAWFRSAGNSGWYSETYGGGWHMTDTTWIRAYNSKNVYTDQVMRADAGMQTSQICNTSGTSCSTPAQIATAVAGGSGSGADVQTFTASGTWTKPSGKNATTIECWGGGGGGGRGSSNRYGGGGGGYNTRNIPTASLSSTVTVTIGAGGTGRTASNGSGTNGGNTTFGSYLTAYGGAGGSSNGGGGGGQLSAGSGYLPGNPKVLSDFVSDGGSPAVTYYCYQGQGIQSAVAYCDAYPAFMHGGGGGSGSAYGANGSVYGGGGGAVGASSGAVQAGGTSSFGGAGGAGGSGAGTAGSNGAQPGGGGGGGYSNNGGNGGAGQCRVTSF